ncbi:ATP-NAD kinase family protein [Prauserella muralis]|uniref:ATP-NAD kinase n=1 Tax=Prauserella muralis TaxID=588067 RepID=A0A2V4B7X4_9PSEU|nr:NAD(+)/NADH kinase [Prauserella muralis]PXY31358.1 ATP-NAD kinase [Prauserella muralis]TWE14320.1 putative polyphosphate/ATP-dependent NAD kinase [Prauserella muralis]
MGAVVGVVANPASGRDIRRLVAQASVFPTAEKANMVRRLLSAFAATGVERAVLSTDLGGISAAVLRTLRTRRPGKEAPWPDVEFCDDVTLTGTADDTTEAVRRMRAEGAGLIVCLGGDGTARVAAAACGDVPLLALSTGTNNAFPRMREATVAGLAGGLVATGAVPPETGTRTASLLEVTAGGRTEVALVDVCVSTSRHVASRALWDPATLTALFCTFAEPDGIGLSSIAGQLCPSPRESQDGVALTFAPPHRARWVVHAPIAPGLVLPVGVRAWRPLRVGEHVALPAGGGVVAVDGERELELTGDTPVSVRLRADGPRCVDVPAVLAESARRGLLRTELTPCQRWRRREEAETA